jgi:MSHA pilin protein MshC
MKQNGCLDKGKTTLYSSHGFTMLEVLCVLLLVGIISTVIISRTMDNSAELIAEVEIVKGHLRYAQTRAMNSNQSWGINFSGSSYTLEEDGTTSTISLPGENGAVGTLALGSISSTVNPVVFNQWGNPGTNPITVTVSDGSDAESFTISPLTGFIP